MKPKKKKWSANVTKKSHALDLQKRVFAKKKPGQIAESLKRSAEQSKSRKANTPFQSAMSMLNFYINRAGSKLPAAQKDRLERAKTALRKIFHRPVH